MKIDYFLTCDHALVGQDGKPTLVGVFDKINPTHDLAKDKPWIHPRLSAVYQIAEPTPLKGSVKLQLVAPSGEVLFQGNLEYDVKPTNKIGGIMEMAGLKFPEYGIYSFQILVEDKLVGERKIGVQKR